MELLLYFGVIILGGAISNFFISVVNNRDSPIVEEEIDFHKMELEEWDKQFKEATGKDPFPKPTVIKGTYNDLLAPGLQNYNQQLENIYQHTLSQQQQLQQMQQMQFGGMGNIFGGLLGQSPVNKRKQ